MAESDMKPLSELDLYNDLMDENSLLPMTVRPSGSNITRKVYFNALKTQIAGYDLVGTLTAGSTSITLSSTGTTYNEQTAYAVGARVTYTDPNVQGAEAKNYICTHACSAGQWGTNAPNFVEYPLLDSNSNIRIFTTVFGVNPTAATIENNAITLTFPAQSSDISVKVRVY
jgi:hypothetical protein